MRVAHVNDIAFVASAMVHGLLERGVDARLVDPARPGARTRYPWKLATRPLRLASLVDAALELRRGRFDLVHVHFARLGLLGPASGRPFVLHCHGTDIRGVRPGSVWGREVAPALRRAALVFYATPDLRPWVEAFRPDAVFLPNPIEPCPPDALAIAPERDVLVAVRLDPVKGAERIEELIRELVAARPTTSVTIVDHGSGVASVAAAAGRRVDVIRPVPHDRMPGLVRRHRVMIGQQRVGALGNLELEAMAASVPVAAAFRYRDAYPVPPPLVDGPVHDVIQRLVTLLDDEPARVALGATDASWVRAHHDLALVADRLLEAYLAILGARDAGGVANA